MEVSNFIMNIDCYSLQIALIFDSVCEVHSSPDKKAERELWLSFSKLET